MVSILADDHSVLDRPKMGSSPPSSRGPRVNSLDCSDLPSWGGTTGACLGLWHLECRTMQHANRQ